MTNRTYYVIWTYVANYSNVIEVKAENAEKARELIFAQYGVGPLSLPNISKAEFRAKAAVHVFDSAPHVPLLDRLHEEALDLSVQQHLDIRRLDQ
jgi:hypothetical protein